MKANVTMSPETQGFVGLLQIYSNLYEQTYDVLAAFYGEDAVDGILKTSGFRDRYDDLADVMKRFLSDAVFENICANSPNI
mgnify:CR=1 FL=1